MGNLKSNADALLVAIPMIAVLFAVFFRLDELFFRTKKLSAPRRQVSGVDKNGRPICLDPDDNIRTRTAVRITPRVVK